MTSHVSIRLASERVNHCVASLNELPRFYTPGEVITGVQDFMRGHGTYIEDDFIKSSVAGVMQKVNKLICVKPLKSRYMGEVGDVVVGRILEVQQKRWKVETNSRLDSFLPLSAVNLPGGELRRRSEQDEKTMRSYLQEGDLISAEVQNMNSDGTLSLHTRSVKYGKLAQGILIKVFPSLINRRKNHFHNLLCGVSVIIGNNGYIWISPLAQEMDSSRKNETKIDDAQSVSLSDRDTMARLKNCITALVSSKACVSLPESSPVSKSWVCPECKARTRKGENTPVRPLAAQDGGTAVPQRAAAQAPSIGVSPTGLELQDVRQELAAFYHSVCVVSCVPNK